MQVSVQISQGVCRHIYNTYKHTHTHINLVMQWTHLHCWAWPCSLYSHVCCPADFMPMLYFILALHALFWRIFVYHWQVSGCFYKDVYIYIYIYIMEHIKNCHIKLILKWPGFIHGNAVVISENSIPPIHHNSRLLTRSDPVQNAKRNAKRGDGWGFWINHVSHCFRQTFDCHHW